MTKKLITKIVVLGFLQYIILNVTIFVISLIFSIQGGSEMAAPPALGMTLVVLIMVGVGHAFTRWFKPANRKQAIATGIVWSGMTTALLVVTLVANSTTSTFLSSWVAYLIFIAQAVGSLTVNVNQSSSVTPTSPPTS